MSTRKLTPDEYMDLLRKRAAEHDEKVRANRREKGLPPLRSWVRTLPADMMRDDDEDILDHAAFEAAIKKPAAPKRETKPRTYLPASYWAQELKRAEAHLEALYARYESPTTDRAAWGGQVNPRLVKQARRAFTDTAIDKVITAQKRVEHLRSKYQSALRREAKA